MLNHLIAMEICNLLLVKCIGFLKLVDILVGLILEEKIWLMMVMINLKKVMMKKRL